MKRLVTLLLAVLLLSGAGMAGKAQAAFMNNWYFNAAGTGFGGSQQVGEWLDITSVSYVKNTLIDATNFNFENLGFIVSNTFDGASSYSPFVGEITGKFKVSGSGQLGGALNFLDGTLSVYSHATKNYGTATSLFGSDDGVEIARFSLDSGDGLVNAQGLPTNNGQITMRFIADFIAPNYWFDPSGQDLATLPSYSVIFGQSTTNANPQANPSAILQNEMAEFYGSPVFPNNAPESFFLSGNGQFRLANVVPEPGTALLLGAGLLGLGFVGRRKES